MSKLYISMYHYVRDLKHSRYPNIKGMNTSEFRDQILFLKENFNIVTMEQVIDSIERKNELPEKSVLLTFDDGYIDNYMFVFPILDELKVQGSFFIPGKTFVTHQLLDVNKVHYVLASADTKMLLPDLKNRMDYYRGKEFSFESNDELFEKYAISNRFDTKETIFIKRMLQTVLPEKLRNIISSELFEKYVGVTEEQLAYELYMTEDQIRTMKRHGMYIGFHGYDHYWLGNLEENEMKKDVDMALDALSEFIDKNCWVANYPYGNYNEKVIEYVKKKGAKAGLSTKVGIADLGTDSLFELPRFDCNDFPPKSINYEKY